MSCENVPLVLTLFGWILLLGGVFGLGLGVGVGIGRKQGRAHPGYQGIHLSTRGSHETNPFQPKWPATSTPTRYRRPKPHNTKVY
jgi:hypothetical protein